MTDYSQAKLYVIKSKNYDKVYIGATIQPLKNRFSMHENIYKNKILNKYSSVKIFHYGDAYIELIKNCPCNSKEELNKMEGEEIRKWGNNCVNKRIEGRTKKEYAEANRDKTKLYMEIYNKIWYDERKEDINEKRKELMSCECGSNFRIADKTKHYKTKKHIDFIANK